MFLSERTDNSSVIEQSGMLPSVTSPTILYRFSSTHWKVRSAIINAPITSFVEWDIVDIGSLSQGTTRCFTLGGFLSSESGSRRVQSDYTIHGSVFEFAFNVGRIVDGVGSGLFYGNGHGHVTDTNTSLQMDGITELKDIAVGSWIGGTNFVIRQIFNIRLPQDDVTIIGDVTVTHTFNSTGCTVSHVHDITAPGIFNQNSYSAMMPVTGCNRVQYGNNSVLVMGSNPPGTQSANQGHQTTIAAWSSGYPVIVAEMILPLGNPGLPDQYTNVTTSDTFFIDQGPYSKCYCNFRSGVTALAADTTSTHQTLYRIRHT